jgi:hypothetical protein
MADAPKQALTELMATLRNALKWDFYRRLMRGEVDAAKRMMRFFQTTIQQVNDRIGDDAETYQLVDAEKSQTMRRLWATFRNKFTEFQFKVVQSLETLTSEKVTEEPEVWQDLLRTEFQQVIRDLVDTLAVIERVVKSLDKQMQFNKLMPAQYAKQYSDLRGKMEPQLLERVDRAEAKVRVALSQNPPLLFQKKVSEGMDRTVKWKGYLHAWIAAPYDDYRLVYSFDGKKITFVIVARHKDLGLHGKT